MNVSFNKRLTTFHEYKTCKICISDVCKFMCSLDPEQVECNPDVQEIIHWLQREYEKQGDNSRFFIFVKTRATARALAKRLEHLKNLNCEYFTGSQVGIEDGGEYIYNCLTKSLSI